MTETAKNHQILFGLLLAIVALGFSFSEDAAVTSRILAVAALVLWIAWKDFVTYTIPDAALVALVVIAVFDRVQDSLLSYDPLLGISLMGIDAFLAGGCVLLVREIYYRRRGVDGIGFGDVKLAVVGGLLCGIGGFAWALFAASVLGLLIAFVVGRGGTGLMAKKLPFGALLAPLLWAVWVWT